MSPTAKVWIDLAPFLGIGWVFVLSIGAFAALGWWLDARLGTGRKLFIGGAIFGIIIGFLYFYRVVVELNQRKRKAR